MKIFTNSLIALDGEAISYEEAIQGDNPKKWKEAKQEELGALRKSETWKLVEPVGNMKILDSKWVLKKKIEPDGKTEKYRARLLL